ncbi:FCD domain-containing protein [Mycolicibacterium mucogenicum]|nr:FCD domain-containing protein [Mycolicibacterium mucogenicum]
MLEVRRPTPQELPRVLRADPYGEIERGSSAGTLVTELDEAYARWVTTMAADRRILRRITDVRVAVESQIAWLAAQRRIDHQLDAMRDVLELNAHSMSVDEFHENDLRFHGLLAEAAGSPRLTSLMQSMRSELFSPASAPPTSSSTIVPSHQEHRAIYEAVAAAEPELAATRMRIHLQSNDTGITACVPSHSMRSLSRTTTREQSALPADAMYTNIRYFLQNHFADAELSLEHVARHHNISRRYLEGLFARRAQSPAAYIRGLRLERARLLLQQQSTSTIESIAYQAGFADVGTFIRAFRREYGETPGQWRRRNQTEGAPGYGGQP